MSGFCGGSSTVRLALARTFDVLTCAALPPAFSQWTLTFPHRCQEHRVRSVHGGEVRGSGCGRHREGETRCRSHATAPQGCSHTP